MDVLCWLESVSSVGVSRSSSLVVLSFDLGGGLGGKLFCFNSLNPGLNVMFVMFQVRSNMNSSHGSN